MDGQAGGSRPPLLKVWIQWVGKYSILGSLKDSLGILALPIRRILIQIYDHPWFNDPKGWGGS